MFTLSHGALAIAVTNITKFPVCNAVLVALGEPRMTCITQAR
jgi:hypothetical protein